MLRKIIMVILDRLLKDPPPSYGSINVRLFFHEGRFVKYEYEKSETTVMKHEEENGKQ